MRVVSAELRLVLVDLIQLLDSVVCKPTCVAGRTCFVLLDVRTHVTAGIAGFVSLAILRVVVERTVLVVVLARNLTLHALELVQVEVLHDVRGYGGQGSCRYARVSHVSLVAFV